ncbi:type II secretion system protein N [Chitinimonas sp. PSY-7]|uniref:type II secretion system protein N n=1 Tax=Chitinimonas sp. PSY-7 TaxID=3459088 RepID=UPI00403FF45C
MIISLPASPWFYRCLNGLLVLLTAWLAAGFLWQLFAPKSPLPVAAPNEAPVVQASTDMSALNALFGEQAKTEVSLSSLGLKLRGVIATASPAAAIFERSGASALAVKTGEEVEPGVRLVEVAGDHALLDNRGRRERIDLDAKPAAQGVSPYAPPQVDTEMEEGPPSLPPRMPEPITTSRAANMGATTQSRGGENLVISRQALAAGMQNLNINDWVRGLSDAPGGAGLLVDNAAAQPLAGPLGLQSGDVLTKVNGSPLKHATDVSALYSAFSRSNTVNIELLRNGTPMNLRFSIESQSAQ